MKKKKKNIDLNETVSGIIFLLPGLIGFLIFILFPVIFSLFLSLFKWSFISGFEGMKFVGFKNFVLLFSDPYFITSLQNNVIISLTTVPITLVLGIVFAVLIKNYAYGKVGIRAMMFVPYVSSIVAVSVVFKVILNPEFGPVNKVLMFLGVQNPPKWFGDMHWALVAIIILTVWMNIGYYIVIYMAGLTNVPKTLYEAAEIDGAGPLKQFFSITIPGVSPTTLFLTVIGLINSFKIFDQVSITTNGGPGSSTFVFALYIYKLAFQQFDTGYASAVTMFMTAVIAIITIVQWKMQNNKVDFMM